MIWPAGSKGWAVSRDEKDRGMAPRWATHGAGDSGCEELMAQEKPSASIPIHI